MRFMKAAPLVLLVFLSACAGPKPLAPVTDRSAPLRQPASDYRVVVAGDTLYSIAWESGRDYRELAAWNHIPHPYTIKPGQRLRLYPPAKTPIANAQAVKKAPKTAPARKTHHQATAHPRKQYRPSPAATSWRWPTDGAVISTFASNSINKGIDIGGARGQSIRAAASGRVVYSGSGLRGYGQLIILKHNDDFLSAYAHNDKVYVKEGDMIKSGQQIAAMGSSGTDRTKLHFEIRRHGVPVDPLQYLPKK
jgi:lipoprotein NlpD